jgi:hypothetical protein
VNDIQEFGDKLLALTMEQRNLIDDFVQKADPAQGPLGELTALSLLMCSISTTGYLLKGNLNQAKFGAKMLVQTIEILGTIASSQEAIVPTSSQEDAIVPNFDVEQLLKEMRKDGGSNPATES